MNMRNLFLTLAFGLCSGVFAQNTTVFESPIMGWKLMEYLSGSYQ